MISFVTIFQSALNIYILFNYPMKVSLWCVGTQSRSSVRESLLAPATEGEGINRKPRKSL